MGQGHKACCSIPETHSTKPNTSALEAEMPMYWLPEAPNNMHMEIYMFMLGFFEFCWMSKQLNETSEMKSNY